jgi:uncharacterized membrane protein (GlpM family)
MVQDILGITILVIVYICLGIIILGPTLYLAWFYVVSRNIRGVGKVSLRSLILTAIANVIVGYFIFFLIHSWFYVPAIASNDTIARELVEKTVISEKAFYEKHGRYYQVGPVRGPYSAPNGIKIDKDIILEATRMWDKNNKRESFRVYGMHLWGDKIFIGDAQGIDEENYSDSAQASSIRARLIKSTK